MLQYSSWSASSARKLSKTAAQSAVDAAQTAASEAAQRADDAVAALNKNLDASAVNKLLREKNEAADAAAAAATKLDKAQAALKKVEFDELDGVDKAVAKKWNIKSKDDFDKLIDKRPDVYNALDNSDMVAKKGGKIKKYAIGTLASGAVVAILYGTLGTMIITDNEAMQKGEELCTKCCMEADSDTAKMCYEEARENDEEYKDLPVWPDDDFPQQTELEQCKDCEGQCEMVYYQHGHFPAQLFEKLKATVDDFDSVDAVEVRDIIMSSDAAGHIGNIKSWTVDEDNRAALIYGEMGTIAMVRDQDAETKGKQLCTDSCKNHDNQADSIDAYNRNVEHSTGYEKLIKWDEGELFPDDVNFKNCSRSCQQLCENVFYTWEDFGSDLKSGFTELANGTVDTVRCMFRNDIAKIDQMPFKHIFCMICNDNAQCHTTVFYIFIVLLLLLIRWLLMKLGVYGYK